MSSSAPPIIAFELGVGEFRIVTPEAVYQIKVCRNLVNASSEAVEETPSTAPPDPAEPANDNNPQSTFFKDISEELFDKIGRLARRLSVSVEELPTRLDIPDFDETDQQLESAKGQLEEVVKITEKASMTIMDTADLIQVDMDQLKSQLDILQDLDLMSSPTVESRGEVSSAAIPRRSAIDPALLDKLDQLKSLISSWLQATGQDQQEDGVVEIKEELALPPSAEPQVEIQKTTVIRFDVDVVFQTLYELCTNESVKDHIKAMRAVQSTDFNSQEVADKLVELVPAVDEEDGFYNFPIPEVLKALYASTASEEYRTIIKKMNQTAAGIFLDTVLPIEGEKVEVEVEVLLTPPAAAPVEPEPVAAERLEPAEEEVEACIAVDELKVLKNLVQDIDQLARAGLQPQEQRGASDDAGPSPEEGSSGVASTLYTPILTQDRDTIIKAVGAAHDLIQKTGQHLNHILETLSFQDLSGQRIMRVVSMIGDIQTQLIAILVSANTKLKAHQNSAINETGGEAEKMAQQEVDKALEKLSSNSALKGPGAETRLDQSAVNDLLAQLGF